MKLDIYSDDVLMAVLDILGSRVRSQRNVQPYSAKARPDDILSDLSRTIRDELSKRCHNNRTLMNDVMHMVDSSEYVSLSQENDGRWIADIDSVPGAMAYGTQPYEARNNALAIALRVMADRIEGK